MNIETTVADLRSIDWSALDHCGARHLLERAGWRYVGAGDWAVALADPAGMLAARVSPFEPAFGYYTDLCYRLAGNSWLPTMYFDSPLEGGGQLAVMDLLRSRDLPDDDTTAPEWLDDADDDLVGLRAEIHRLNAVNRQNVAWWGVLDVKAGHFMLGRDGHLKLIDPFGLDGHAMCAAAIADHAAFSRIVPPDRHRYLLQLPHFSQSYAAEQRKALRAACDHS